MTWRCALPADGVDCGDARLPLYELLVPLSTTRAGRRHSLSTDKGPTVNETM